MPAQERTEEDGKIIKEHTLYPIFMDTLEYDIKEIESSKMKMKSIYIGKLRKIQDDLSAEMVEIRRLMKKNGLKVYEESRDKSSVKVKYLCRGYHMETSMLWTYVKSEIQVRLSERLDFDLSKLE